MKANDLADTQVELLNGSAILESTESNPDTSVTLIYTAWKTRFPTKGLYRIDSDPPRLWVYRGKAQAFAEAGAPVAVDEGMSLPLAAVLVPDRSDAPPADALTEWANGRSQSISADNAITAQIDEDPASRASGLDNFAYFPFLGVSSLSLLSSSPYSSVIPAQPGFSSIYLPGYTYRPLLLGVMGGGYGYGSYGYGSYGYGGYGYGGYSYGGNRGYVPSPPRIGSSPGVRIAIPSPRAPIWRPVPSRPLPHPVPHVGHR